MENIVKNHLYKGDFSKITKNYQNVYCNIPKDRESNTEQNELFTYDISIDWSKVLWQILAMDCLFLSEKYVSVLQYISCHSIILGGTKVNLWYVVEFFLLYKMIKKTFKKTHRLGVKMGSQCWPIIYYFSWKFTRNFFYIEQIIVSLG